MRAENASPVVAWIKEREPRFREIRSRVEQQRGPVASPIRASGAGTTSSPTAVADDVAVTDVPAKRTVRPGQAPTLSGRPIPPRPRKKGKKR